MLNATKKKKVTFSFAGDTPEAQKKAFDYYKYWDLDIIDVSKKFTLREVLNILKYRVHLFSFFDFYSGTTINLKEILERNTGKRQSKRDT